MFDLYFVYILQSTSRRALYIGFTKCLVSRVLEHRTRTHPNSFSSKYRTWRLVYYEEFGDSAAAFARERQLKGWNRAKKEALITRLNPHWRDLVSVWEEKYDLEFRLDGRITARLGRRGWASRESALKSGSAKPPTANSNSKTKDPSTPVSHARPTERKSSAPRVPGNAWNPSSAQDA